MYTFQKGQMGGSFGSIQKSKQVLEEIPLPKDNTKLLEEIAADVPMEYEKISLKKEPGFWQKFGAYAGSIGYALGKRALKGLGYTGGAVATGLLAMLPKEGREKLNDKIYSKYIGDLENYKVSGYSGIAEMVLGVSAIAIGGIALSFSYPAIMGLGIPLGGYMLFEGEIRALISFSDKEAYGSGLGAIPYYTVKGIAYAGENIKKAASNITAEIKEDIENKLKTK